jgi:hypothetical protein
MDFLLSCMENRRKNTVVVTRMLITDDGWVLFGVKHM